MRKAEAIALFETPRALAAALGITPQAVYQWPDELPQDQADRVIGAAIRLGKLPADWRPPQREAKGAAA